MSGSTTTTVTREHRCAPGMTLKLENQNVTNKSAEITDTPDKLSTAEPAEIADTPDNLVSDVESPCQAASLDRSSRTDCIVPTIRLEVRNKTSDEYMCQSTNVRHTSEYRTMENPRRPELQEIM